jgi:hypothetical protein
VFGCRRLEPIVSRTPALLTITGAESLPGTDRRNISWMALKKPRENERESEPIRHSSSFCHVSVLEQTGLPSSAVDPG